MAPPELIRRKILRSMVLVRALEDRLTQLSHEGLLPGMQILATGQEAVVAAVLALRDTDVVVSNHRSHAHLLARGAEAGPLVAEIMGKARGVNGGKSGTLHLIVPEVEALLTSTVVGAGPPMAAGAAFAQQYRGSDAITVALFGDGAAAEGSVHEAMNLAAVWKLPVFFVCENNQWAGAQRLDEHCAGGHIACRAEGYGMPGEAVDGNDPDIVWEAATRLAAGVREGRGPALMEVVTYRMHGHGEHDRQHYVDPAELEAWARRDPIDLYATRLLEEGACSRDEVEAMRAEAARTVDDAVIYGGRSPDPPPEEATAHVFGLPSSVSGSPTSGTTSPKTRVRTGGQAVNEALALAMEQDERVFLAGEGVGVSIHDDPMRATHGLLERFGRRRVCDTPVSEAAIAGLGVGAATLGLLPVVEIMFLPFITLASDMIVNHAAKLRYLSGGRTPVPLTVRVKAGLAVQAGCHHVHNLESWLAHAPGLKLAWASNPADAKGLLLSAIFDPDPVVVVEEMGVSRQRGDVPEGDVRVPLGQACIARPGSDVTVAAYGSAVQTALEAAASLEEEGISLEVVDLRSLVPLDRETLLSSVARTGRFVAVHDATRFCGYGAELAALVAEEAFASLSAPVRRVAAPDAPAPFARSQMQAYRPGSVAVVNAVRSIT